MTAAIATQADALAHQGKAAEAANLLDQALARTPDDHELLAARARLAIARGPWASARAWVDKLAASPLVDARDLNQLAWSALYYAGTPDQAKALGERAERASVKVAPALANTLAAIEAASDRPFSAWRYLKPAIEAHRDAVPSRADWYVIGRIAEDYGLRDDAIVAYRRVTPPTVHGLGPSSYDFARRALARLGVP
jgi:tetratricopeptide (TPR) repeat protein